MKMVFTPSEVHGIVADFVAKEYGIPRDKIGDIFANVNAGIFSSITVDIKTEGGRMINASAAYRSPETAK